jgi:hypothetical protein
VLQINKSEHYVFFVLQRTNFIVPRTLSFKNGYRVIQLPRFGIGQTYKPNIHLTENEHQILNNFQPELIYGKVRVQQSRKFVPHTVIYDKKVFQIDCLIKSIKVIDHRYFDFMVISNKQFMKVHLNIIV